MRKLRNPFYFTISIAERGEVLRVSGARAARLRYKAKANPLAKQVVLRTDYDILDALCSVGC